MLNEHTRPLLDKALSTYPLYENEKVYDLIPTREQLNTKLLNHYKYREIGFETVGRFLDELEITMNEIMPRYNELFKTVVTMAELPSPFDNVDFVEKYEEERTGTSTSEGSTTSKQTGTGSQTGSSTAQNTSTTNEETAGSNNTTSTTNSKRVTSDTPQDSLTIGAKGINNVDYASEAEWKEDVNTSSEDNEGTLNRSSNDESTGTTSSETTSSNDEEGTSNVSSQTTDKVTHTFTKVGNQGVNTYAHDMNEFRTAIIDVVDQIINDIRIGELFMMVY